MSWAEGSAIPSPEELAANLEGWRASKATLREFARKANAEQAHQLAELARDGASIAGIHLPPDVSDAIAIIRRAVSLLGFIPIEGLGLSAEQAVHAKEYAAEAAEALDILQALTGK